MTRRCGDSLVDSGVGSREPTSGILTGDLESDPLMVMELASDDELLLMLGDLISDDEDLVNMELG